MRHDMDTKISRRIKSGEKAKKDTPKAKLDKTQRGNLFYSTISLVMHKRNVNYHNEGRIEIGYDTKDNE